MIKPSPVTTGVRANDTFRNLLAGNYTIRLTDACGNYGTLPAIITAPKTQISIYNLYAEKIGCDSVLLTFFVALPIDTTGF